MHYLLVRAILLVAATKLRYSYLVII